MRPLDVEALQRPAPRQPHRAAGAVHHEQGIAVIVPAVVHPAAVLGAGHGHGQAQRAVGGVGAEGAIAVGPQSPAARVGADGLKALGLGDLEQDLAGGGGDLEHAIVLGDPHRVGVVGALRGGLGLQRKRQGGENKGGRDGETHNPEHRALLFPCFNFGISFAPNLSRVKHEVNG